MKLVFKQSGFILGLCLIIGLGCITNYTATRVLRSQYHVPRNVVVFEFPDICRVFLGKWAEILAGVFGVITLLGALLAYWTLMSTFLYNIGEFIHLQVFMIITYELNELRDLNLGRLRNVFFRFQQIIPLCLLRMLQSVQIPI